MRRAPCLQKYNAPARVNCRARWRKRWRFQQGLKYLPATGVIRAGNMRHQIGQARVGMLDFMDRRARDFAQIMRWNFGRHADGNARRAVEQAKRQSRGQKSRFVKRAIVIGLVIDRTFA